MKTAAQGKTVPVPYGRRAPHMVPPARTPQRKERFRTLTREYLVCGGKPLFGEVTISGAKNAAVAILPAALLVKGKCRIENVPDISDVRILLDILAGMGAKLYHPEDHVLEIDCTDVQCTEPDPALVTKMRASYYLMGALLGFFNGILIGKVKMPPFIVTLATMLIYRSLAQYYLRTLRLSIYNMEGTLSAYDPFYSFGQHKVAGLIPMAGVILLLVTVLMVFMSTNTKFGRSIYAIGSNERAARLAGINVEWTQVAVYTITGLLCGVSTFMWLAMNGSVDPATIGKSNEMYAIAAVVIGGISMSGGKGKLLGVLFGAMSYTIIDKIISSLGLDALINDTIKGSILLVAVFIQIVIPAIREKLSRNH